MSESKLQGNSILPEDIFLKYLNVTDWIRTLKLIRPFCHKYLYYNLVLRGAQRKTRKNHFMPWIPPFCIEIKFFIIWCPKSMLSNVIIYRTL